MIVLFLIRLNIIRLKFSLLKDKTKINATILCYTHQNVNFVDTMSHGTKHRYIYKS